MHRRICHPKWHFWKKSRSHSFLWSLLSDTPIDVSKKVSLSLPYEDNQRTFLFFSIKAFFLPSLLPWHCSSPFFKFNSQPPSFASLDLLNLRANKFRAWNTINNKIWLVLLSAATRLFWLGRSIERFACRWKSISISNSRIFWDKFVHKNYICLSYFPQNHTFQGPGPMKPAFSSWSTYSTRLFLTFELDTDTRHTRFCFPIFFKCVLSTHKILMEPLPQWRIKCVSLVKVTKKLL